MAFTTKAKSRAMNTCLSCKKRKIKCDKTRPSCRRCVQSDILCVYGLAALEPGTLRFIETDPSASSSQAEYPVMPTTENPSGGSRTVTISIDHLREVDERLSGLTKAVEAMQRASGVLPTSSAEEPEQQRNESRPLFPNLPSQPPRHSRSAETTTDTGKTENPRQQQGFLNTLPDGTSRFIEDTHWAFICEEIDEIRELLQEQARYDVNHDHGLGFIRLPLEHLDLDDASDIMVPVPDWDRNGQATTRIQRLSPRMFEGMPSRAQCDFLVASYTLGYYPVTGYVNLVEFNEKYEAFWKWKDNPYRSQESSPTPAFLCLMSAVIFAGSVTCDADEFSVLFPGERHTDVDTRLYRIARTNLKLASFPRAPSVDSFAAYMMIQVVWLRAEEPLTCCAFVGLLIRVAHMLGLHKDPSHLQSISPIAAEFRRRVWWNVVHMDTTIAAWSGLPQMLENGSWTTHEVARYGTDIYKLPPTDEAPAVSLLLSGKLKETTATREILDIIHNTDMDEPQIQKIHNVLDGLEADLKPFIEQLARLANTASARLNLPGNSSLSRKMENEARLCRFAQSLLCALVDKNWSVAFSSILRSSGIATWPGFRSQALKHCQRFVSSTIWLSCHEDFKPYHWSWPGNHQPLHALMVLLRDLDQYPTGSSAEESRILIEEAFALCSPEGGITTNIGNSGMVQPRPLTEGGQEVWDLLKRFRSRAWQKLDLNPRYFWTREQAVHSIRRRLGQHISGNERLHSVIPVESGILGADLSENVYMELEGVPELDWDMWDSTFTNRGTMDVEFDEG